MLYPRCCVGKCLRRRTKPSLFSKFETLDAVTREDSEMEGAPSEAEGGSMAFKSAEPRTALEVGGRVLNARVHAFLEGASQVQNLHSTVSALQPYIIFGTLFAAEHAPLCFFPFFPFSFTSSSPQSLRRATQLCMHSSCFFLSFPFSFTFFFAAEHAEGDAAVPAPRRSVPCGRRSPQRGGCRV